MKRHITQTSTSSSSTPTREVALLTTMNERGARMLSSSVGSVLTSLAVNPLDVAKIRIQNEIHPHTNAHIFHKPCPRGCGTIVWKDSCRRTISSLALATQSHYGQSSSSKNRSTTITTPTTSTWTMLRKIWLEEGFSGLYRGIRPTLVMAVPNTMVYYTAYDELVQHLRQALPAHGQGYAPILAGGSARLLASSATAPLEYLRTREASRKAGQASSLTVRKIIQTQGLAALYRGLAPTLWRDVPFSAIYWLVIEELRNVWRTRNGGQTPTTASQQFVQSFINGLIAGTISACCTTPFDVVKTRQQSQLLPVDSPKSTPSVARCSHNGASPILLSFTQSGGTWRALRQVAHQEGITALWRGNWARTAKVAPSCAIMISSYEVGKRFLLAEFN